MAHQWACSTALQGWPQIDRSAVHACELVADGAIDPAAVGAL